MAREQTVRILAEMVANVIVVEVAVDDEVAAGDPVCLLESMKMEIPVLTEHAGVVVGDQGHARRRRPGGRRPGGAHRTALSADLAEGAGFEPAADISASDRFQGGSDRPLRHPSERDPRQRRRRRAESSCRATWRLLGAADLQLHVVVGQVVHPLVVVGDVDQQPVQPVGEVVDIGATSTWDARAFSRVSSSSRSRSVREARADSQASRRSGCSRSSRRAPERAGGGPTSARRRGCRGRAGPQEIVEGGCRRRHRGPPECRPRRRWGLRRCCDPLWTLRVAGTRAGTVRIRRAGDGFS